jgi:hypothetical protein
MTTFKDGPAGGVRLMLKRAPIFLRAVKGAQVGKNNGWDALDQPNDRPNDGEVLFAYELRTRPGVCHIRMTGGGGFYPVAEYWFCDPQPTDADMRTAKAWAATTLRLKNGNAFAADQYEKGAR